MGMQQVTLCLEGPTWRWVPTGIWGCPQGGHEVALAVLRACRLCWWHDANRGHSGDRMEQDLSHEQLPGTGRKCQRCDSKGDSGWRPLRDTRMAHGMSPSPVAAGTGSSHLLPPSQHPKQARPCLHVRPWGG